MAPPTVTVLAYHRIAQPDSRGLSPTLIDAYPADFAAQMRYVARSYHVISSWDLVRAIREGQTLPPRALIITFDDGYHCFLDTAFPILQRLGLPVTLFVPTDYPGIPGAMFWWDKIYRALQHTHHTQIEVPGLGPLLIDTPARRRTVYEWLVARVERTERQNAARLVEAVVAACGVSMDTAQAMLNWDEIAGLAAAGVNVGPHTRSHIILAQATPERIQEEVVGSWADLQAHVPQALPLFCYPNGKPHAINALATRTVRQAGLVGAYTMVAGLNVIGHTNPYLLHRVGMVAGESLYRFAFKLTLAGRLYRLSKALLKGRAAERFNFVP